MTLESHPGPRIAILGTGAQGASLGLDFTLAGLDVTLIDQWPENIVAMRENGLTVTFPDGRRETAKVKALHLCQVAELREPFDVVFLVVKAYDTTWATQLIASVLAPDGFVVGLQNGMTHEQIAAIVGRERTIGAVIEMASNMFVPGISNWENDRDTAWFAMGALEPRMQDRVEGVADLLRHTGRVEVMNDIHSAKWMKLVVNAAELIPSAILDLPIMEAARSPGYLEVMRAAGYEAIEAATDDGASIFPIIGMPPVKSNHPERYVDAIFDEVLKNFSTPTTLSTSLQDWRKGRRAEVREINGLAADTLRRHGKPSPFNDRVVELALRIERGELAAHPDNGRLLIETLGR